MGVTYVIRKKLYSGKLTCDLNRRRNCFRDVGLRLMKYRWAIDKSIQGVPVKVKQFKIEITLEILGLGNQLDINGKLRRIVTQLKMIVKKWAH